MEHNQRRNNFYEKILDQITEIVGNALNNAAMMINTERQEYPTDLIYVNISATEQWQQQRNIRKHHL